jgi:hypothetical protein
MSPLTLPTVSFAPRRSRRTNASGGRPFVESVGGVLVDPSSFFDGLIVDRNHQSGSASRRRSGRSDEWSGTGKIPLRVRGGRIAGAHGHGVSSAGKGRRPLLSLLAVAVLFGVVLVGGEVASADAKPAPAPPAQLVRIVVLPGESMWSIARMVQPSGDIRPLVDSLVAQHGSASIVAGEVLTIDLSSTHAD